VANFAAAMNLSNPMFFTYFPNLAKAAADRGTADQSMLWKIKRHAIEFQNNTLPLQPRSSTSVRRSMMLLTIAHIRLKDRLDQHLLVHAGTQLIAIMHA
jgi:hypothetical protein